MRDLHKSFACIGGACFSLPRPLAGALFLSFSRSWLRIGALSVGEGFPVVLNHWVTVLSPPQPEKSPGGPQGE